MEQELDLNPVLSVSSCSTPPMATRHVLEYGERRIPFSLLRSNRRHLRIVVSVDLAVNVHAPNASSEQYVWTWVRRKAPWIVRTLDRMEKFHPLPAPKNYVSGETFVYLGRQYRLHVEEGPFAAARLHGRYLFVTVPDKTVKRHVKNAVDKWYAVRAAESFSRLLEKSRIVGERHGISNPILVIRKMRTRWGSCASTGRITLNVDLVQTPVHCVEYVVMHELCHLKHHNHSQEFYRLLARCMPDWHRRKRILNQISLPKTRTPAP